MNLLDARICIPLDSVAEPFDPAPSPEALAMQAQSRQRIYTLFCRLFRPRDAEILACLYLDGLTTEETAQQFKVSLRVVRYVRETALKVLRTNADIDAILRPTATT